MICLNGYLSWDYWIAHSGGVLTGSALEPVPMRMLNSLEGYNIRLYLLFYRNLPGADYICIWQKRCILLLN